MHVDIGTCRRKDKEMNGVPAFFCHFYSYSHLNSCTIMLSRFANAFANAFEDNLEKASNVAMSSVQGLVVDYSRKTHMLTCWDLRRSRIAWRVRGVTWELRRNSPVNNMVVVDAQDARGCPVVLVQCKLSVHVFSMLRLKFIGRFAVFGQLYGFVMHASEHLLALSCIDQRETILYAHDQEGRFHALCRVVYDVGTQWWLTTISQAGAPCVSVGDKDYSTWFVELHPTTGTVTTRAHWKDQAYCIVHALEDGTLLGTLVVCDWNEKGVHHIVNGIKRTILVKATARSSSFCTTMGLPFVGYIAEKFQGGFLVETCMRSALRMSLPRHSWMQACAC